MGSRLRTRPGNEEERATRASQQGGPGRRANVVQNVRGDAGNRSHDLRSRRALPGVNAVTAATLVAAIGDVARFPTPRQLVSCLDLNPTVRQSGNEKARHGRISKQGAPLARHALVEAAWHAARTPGPLRAFWQRVAAKRGGNIATMAVARKLASHRPACVQR